MSFKSDYGSEVDLNKFLKKILLSKNGEKLYLKNCIHDGDSLLGWLVFIVCFDSEYFSVKYS